MSQADQVPDKIDTHYRLQLSALLDGALSPDEARFLLRRLQHDEALGDCWARWQLCGDILRGHGNIELPERMLPADFAARVARAIAAGNDSPAIPASVAKSPGWLRWGGGAALAASVALVAVMVVRQDPGPAATPASVEVATTPVPEGPMQDTAAPASAPAALAADTAALAAGVAVAATEVPRRANTRRASASRTTGSRRIAEHHTTAASIQPPRDIVASANPATAADMTAAPTTLAVATSTSDSDQFVLRQPPQSRPWPRALVPTSPANGGFTVGHAGTPTLLAFPPFQARTPAIESDAEAGEDANAGVEAFPPR